MTGTRVFVARVGRQTKTREYKDLEAHFTAHLGYSHHQKAVIVDAPIEDHIGLYIERRMASNSVLTVVEFHSEAGEFQ